MNNESYLTKLIFLLEIISVGTNKCHRTFGLTLLSYFTSIHSTEWQPYAKNINRLKGFSRLPTDCLPVSEQSLLPYLQSS